MQLVLAVHPGNINSEGYRSFLLDLMKSGKKVFLIQFSSDAHDTWFLKRIELTTPGLEGKCIAVEPIEKGNPATILPYLNSFKRVLEKIKINLDKNEKIEPIFTGGSAEACLKGIGPAALKMIKKELGPKRIESPRSFLPLIYGRREKTTERQAALSNRSRERARRTAVRTTVARRKGHKALR